jgi:hypothetical protein
MIEQATPQKLAPGTRVRITQYIVGREEVWQTQVEGAVIRHGPEPTGSWFAHGKDDRFWLDRVRLKKSDGEITTLTLDQNSKVEIL